MIPDTRPCLLLDLGMVVVALEHGRFASRMSALTGLGPDELKTLFGAGDFVRRFETGKISSREFFDEVCRRSGVCLAWPDFLAAWNSMIGEQMLADELLAALARNTRLWVISNTNEMHFDHLNRNFDFLRHFEGCILSHKVGALKPDPVIFRHALAEMQASSSRVVFVDDQEVNVIAALKLGVEAFQFLNPGQLTSELHHRGLL